MGASYWIVGGLVLLVGELLHPALVFCWFALGALVVGLAAALGLASLTAQGILFAVLSTTLVTSSRTIFRRYLMRASPGSLVRTNVNALPGQAASVITRIDNAKGEGRVMLDGMEWTARSLDDQPIPEGSRVRVITVDGVKLIVDRDL